MQHSRVWRMAAPHTEGKESASLRVVALRPDFATLSRYAGHVIFGALLIALLYGVIPAQPAVPDLDALLPEKVSSQESVAMASPALVSSVSSERYLEPGNIPLTIHSWRGTLPLGTEPRKPVRTSVIVYTVQPGDTLLGIAQRFGLKGTTLLYANDSLDNPDLLKVGQTLYILPVDGVYHTVAQGETLESIAKKYKVDPEVIAKYPGNELSPPYELQAGQKLIVPGGTKPYVPRRVTTYRVGSATQAGVQGTGTLAWPMSGRISQGFWEGHRAIDIAAARGTPVLAADGGVVVAAHYSNVGYGRMVVIDHGNGYQTLYAHLDVYYVEVGQVVSKGDVIGKCGSTGNSTGPHLHFEVRKNGVRLNPFNFLP